MRSATENVLESGGFDPEAHCVLELIWPSSEGRGFHAEERSHKSRIRHHDTDHGHIGGARMPVGVAHGCQRRRDHHRRPRPEIRPHQRHPNVVGPLPCELGRNTIRLGEGALLTVSATALEVSPPPAAKGLKTVIDSVAGVAMSDAKIVAVSCSELLNVVGRLLPLICTTEFVTKPLPVTVTVNVGPRNIRGRLFHAMLVAFLPKNQPLRGKETP